MADLTTLANVKAYLNLGQETESGTIPSAPGPYTITVDKATGWNGDGGVIFKASGALLTPVVGAPGAGQYSMAAGVYTFNAADTGKEVEISYSRFFAEDALLSRLITAASAFLQGEIGYETASQSYAEVKDGHGGTRLFLGKPPLTAVASVKVDGTSIPAASGVIGAGFRYDAWTIWLNGYAFTRGNGNVEIACTRGYAAVPDDLEQACIELVALRYKERDRIGQTSIALGDGQTVAFVKTLPDSVKDVIEAYKKVAPV